jgi:cyclopropane fatty-acyl-phospholipid synthase-like methyltransferase
MTAQHSVLELGCGTGLFLAYLEAKGVAKFTGMTVTRKAGTLCQLV